jgi:hypothetical protein
MMMTGQTLGDRSVRTHTPHKAPVEIEVVERHIMAEGREHWLGPECWCFPRLEYVNPDTGTEVWVHHEPH